MKKSQCLPAYSLQMEKLEMHITSLKRPSHSTHNFMPTVEMLSPRSLRGSPRTCHTMGHCKRRVEALCQGPVLTLAPLCAHSYLLSFVNCMVWPSTQMRGLMVLIVVGHLLGHCAKCFVCSFLLI